MIRQLPSIPKLCGSPEGSPGWDSQRKKLRDRASIPALLQTGPEGPAEPSSDVVYELTRLFSGTFSCVLLSCYEAKMSWPCPEEQRARQQRQEMKAPRFESRSSLSLLTSALQSPKGGAASPPPAA